MADYKNLDVWRKAHSLTLTIYQFTTTFPGPERYGLISQMRRASSSIPMNLAESSGRASDRDYARFVSNAIGSVNELEYQLLLAEDLGYGRGPGGDEARTLTTEVRRMPVAFRRTLVDS
jgi:four helix bundle protein